MDASTYRQRRTAFNRPRSYRLTGDALVWSEEGKGEDRLFYKDIREVRIAYRPDRVQTNRYITTLKTRTGWKLLISNSSYTGFATFQDHSPEYRAFILELHRRLAASGLPIVFAKGSTRAGYLGNLLLVLFIFAGLAFVLWMTGGQDRAWYVDAKLWTIVFFLPVLFVFIRKAKPERYDPLAPAADGLPEAAAER